MDIIELLASDNYIMCNKMIAKRYGIEEAILLGAMCSYQKGFKNKEFYREQEKILDDTALTLYSLRKAMKTLQELKILSVEKKGLPAKHYYKINSKALEECLSSRPIENDSTGAVENDSTNNNYNNNNNYNKENITKENSISEISTVPNANIGSTNMFEIENVSPSSRSSCTNEGKTVRSFNQPIQEQRTVAVDSGKEIISFILKDNSIYSITESEYNEFAEAYQNVNIMQELKKIRAWCMSNPSKRKTRRGALKFVNNWLSNAQEKIKAYNNVSYDSAKKNIQTQKVETKELQEGLFTFSQKQR